MLKSPKCNLQFAAHKIKRDVGINRTFGYLGKPAAPVKSFVSFFVIMRHGADS
jgi:hypothetical protein